MREIAWYIGARIVGGILFAPLYLAGLLLAVAVKVIPERGAGRATKEGS